MAGRREVGRWSFWLALFLAGCVTPQQHVTLPQSSASDPPAAVSKFARQAVDLPIATAMSAPLPGAPAALAAFRRSCPALLRRADQSGLTRAGDWDGPCVAAATATDAIGFFADHFIAMTIGSPGGDGFATGYFEPEIIGNRSPGRGYPVPLYRRPADLVEVDLGKFAKDLQGRKLRGRIEGANIVPYHTRGEIMAGALAGKGLELAWAADPYEAFFVEIQGSGRLRMPDGRIMRIGYDSQNGREYVAIGKVLRDAGELPKGGVSMDSILGWLRSNPARAPAILAANPSVVFFREITATAESDGPVGALGIAITPRVSVATDPAFIPLGAPLLVTTTLPGNRPLASMMVAQDTGGAIKGANRIDLFMGAGNDARADASAQAADAKVAILLPRAAVARLLAR